MRVSGSSTVWVNIGRQQFHLPQTGGVQVSFRSDYTCTLCVRTCGNDRLLLLILYRWFVTEDEDCCEENSCCGSRIK